MANEKGRFRCCVLRSAAEGHISHLAEVAVGLLLHDYILVSERAAQH